MEEAGRPRRAGLQITVADAERSTVRIAVGDVADGDLVRIERAAARDPVVQVPGEDAFLERHALELLDIPQRPQRRVVDLHRHPCSRHTGCHTPRPARFPPSGDTPIDCLPASIRRSYITMLPANAAALALGKPGSEGKGTP